MPDAPGRARYRRILRFAARHLIVIWWYDVLLPILGLDAIAERTRTARMQRFAARFRVLAVELGGLMIKLGQFLSSRLDVLPPEITKELEGLQDEVPPVPFDRIRALAEAELGLPLDRVFARVDPDPIAAASLGQAYRARLSERDDALVGFAGVVIKVQRPGIGEIVAVDLAALRRVAGWLRRFRAVSSRVDVRALVDEFATTSREETDYLHEGANAERFADAFEGDARVRVPAVVWERTTRKVLTLEDVTAIKITDHDGLRASGIEPAAVAPVFASIMFDQFFNHGFFHADPHPGNLFVTPGAVGPAGRQWTLTFVDFGMMGEIPTRLKTSLRKLLIASAARDGRGMVRAMEEAGVLLPGADTHELERVMTQVFARFGGMGFAELRDIDPREFRDFALEFGDVMLTAPFQMPENFLMLIRAVSLTSGVCSGLDPQYNVWDTVEPYAQQLIREESGHVVAELGREAVEMVGMAWRLPRRIDSVLGSLEDGSIAVTVPKLESAVARAESAVRRLVSALVFAALLVSGAMVHATSTGLSWFLMAASAVPFSHAVFGRRGSR